jgi:3-phenylpropionate/trans-cinnamate dioxygenase ferredoxin subunit
MTWVDVCGVGDIQTEDLMRFDHQGKVYAIYHSPDGKFFATDGLCTHEQFPLFDGFVYGDVIECPKHNGRFEYRTGKAVRLPACENLGTYPVRVVGDRVELAID